MPACHLRHDRARRKRFRDDPPLVRVTPPSPATNATANLDAPSRRGSVNYMVDHICEPMPSTGSHLPNYAARCKMGERHRLRRRRTRVDNFKATDVASVSKVIHTDNQLQAGQFGKRRLHRVDTEMRGSWPRACRNGLPLADMARGTRHALQSHSFLRRQRQPSVDHFNVKFFKRGHSQQAHVGAARSRNVTQHNSFDGNLRQCYRCALHHSIRGL